MDLDSIVLSEISQMENDKYCMTSLICRMQKNNKQNNQTKNFIDTENILMVTRGERVWEEGEMSEEHLLYGDG